MTPEQYFDYHKKLCVDAVELSMKKNNDYADPSRYQDDPLAPFKNFLQCHHLGICSVEQGFLVRLSDKFSRLCNLLKPGHKRAVKDETLTDTILDIINYVCLLSAYIEAN